MKGEYCLYTYVYTYVLTYRGFMATAAEDESSQVRLMDGWWVQHRLTVNFFSFSFSVSFSFLFFGFVVFLSSFLFSEMFWVNR